MGPAEGIPLLGPAGAGEQSTAPPCRMAGRLPSRRVRSTVQEALAAPLPSTPVAKLLALTVVDVLHLCLGSRPLSAQAATAMPRGPCTSRPAGLRALHNSASTLKPAKAHDTAAAGLVLAAWFLALSKVPFMAPMPRCQDTLHKVGACCTLAKSPA